jgi:FixJ family two-component response regulator
MLELPTCVRAGTFTMPYQDVVFVVDDDMATLQAIERLLRQFGYLSKLFATAEAFEDHDDHEGLASSSTLT